MKFLKYTSLDINSLYSFVFYFTNYWLLHGVPMTKTKKLCTRRCYFLMYSPSLTHCQETARHWKDPDNTIVIHPRCLSDS